MQFQIILSLIFVIPPSLGNNDDTLFILDYIRHSQEDNDLQFRCASATTREPIANPRYYVNTTQVEEELFSPTSWGHSYRITRDREGKYSCGVNGSSSNEYVLLASPEIDDTIQTNYSTSVGGEVTLECPIPRGAMQALYSFQWIRNFNPLPFSDTILFAFEESRFKLTILNTPATANGSYLCRATISPPVGNSVDAEASVQLHVSAAASPSGPLKPSTTVPVTRSSQKPNTETTQSTPTPVGHPATERPTPSPSNDGADTGTPLSKEIMIAIIACGTVIAIPVVVIVLLAVVHRFHNQWIINKARDDPRVAELAQSGRLRACGANDQRDLCEAQLQMEENGQ